MLDNYEIDTTLKYKFIPIKFKLGTLAYKIKRLKSQGYDAYNYSLFKDSEYKSYNQIEFYECLANLDYYYNACVENHKKLVEKRKLEYVTSSSYQIKHLWNMCKNIPKKDNPYQVFFDSLSVRYFLYYVGFTFSDLPDISKFANFKEVKLLPEERKFYFKTTIRLLEIMYNPLLTDEEKQSILNKHHTSTIKVRYSDDMIQAILTKNNLLLDAIPENSQKILINAYTSQFKRNPLISLYKLK